MHHFRLMALMLLCVTPVMAQRPNFPGTVDDVTTINTNKLLTLMNAGDGNFIPVAAHRGYWKDEPENSLQAVSNAFDLGMEAVEIDVRLASTLQTNFFQTATPGVPSSYGLLNDPTGALVLSHDECIDREVTGSGALRGAATSKCLTSTGYSMAQFTAMQLRDRTGSTVIPNTSTVYGPPPTLAQVITTFKNYLSIDSTGTLRGPVLVIDLKDKDVKSPVSNACSECMAYNEYVYGLGIMKSIITDSRMWPAVVWKLKMAAALPSATAIAQQIGSQSSNNYGHVLMTINPEDVNNTAMVEPDDGDEFQEGENVDAGYGPLGTSFLTLLGYATVSVSQPVPYVTQFEWVPFNANDGSSPFITSAPTGKKPMNSFATYYQPSFYPEGVAMRFGTCCYLAPLNTAEATPPGQSGPPNSYSVDTRGILEFATYYDGYPTGLTPLPHVATITSDNLLETLNYLVATDRRDLFEIQ